jgi:hypothetical protein
MKTKLQSTSLDFYWEFRGPLLWALVNHFLLSVFREDTLKIREEGREKSIFISKLFPPKGCFNHYYNKTDFFSKGYAKVERTTLTEE